MGCKENTSKCFLLYYAATPDNGERHPMEDCPRSGPKQLQELGNGIGSQPGIDFVVFDWSVMVDSPP